MSPRVIPLAASDYGRIVHLWRVAGLSVKPNGRDARQAFERQMEAGRQIVLGCENDQGELIAVVVATHDGRKGWMNRLAVEPGWRRQGVATLLLRAAEDALRDAGIEIFAALIEPENKSSLATFLAAGYVDWPGIHYVSRRDREDV